MAEWLGNKDNIISSLQDRANRVTEVNLSNEILQRLESLKQALYAQEQQFYADFGYPNSAKDALKQLQEKLNVLNTDIGFRNMVNMSDNDFDNIVESAAGGIDMSEPITIVLNKKGKKQLNEICEDIGEQTQIDAIEYLTQLRDREKQAQITSKGKKSGKKTSTLKGVHLIDTSGKGRGLTKLATFDIVRKKSEIKLQVSLQEGSLLKTKEIKKLEEILQGSIEGKQVDIRDNLKNAIVERIQDSDLRAIVEPEFTKEWYDVNSSEASIKGFLGEIHAYAAAKYLFGEANIAATGNIRNLRGQEIPVDLVLNEYGFQVKNYRVSSSGDTTFQYKGKAGNFIEERIAPEQELGQMLQTFFGLYAYYGEKDEFSQAAKKELTVTKEDAGTDGSVITLFNSHLDNIMHIAQTFKNRDVTSQLFRDQKTYYNTFFIISDKLVPSSMIVQAMIDELGTKRMSRTVFRPYWGFNGLTPTGIKDGDNTPLKLANTIDVNLSLVMNVNKVLTTAVQISASQSNLKNS